MLEQCVKCSSKLIYEGALIKTDQGLKCLGCYVEDSVVFTSSTVTYFHLEGSCIGTSEDESEVLEHIGENYGEEVIYKGE